MGPSSMELCEYDPKRYLRLVVHSSLLIHLFDRQGTLRVCFIIFIVIFKTLGE
jgi:hypothetical protein